MHIYIYMYIEQNEGWGGSREGWGPKPRKSEGPRARKVGVRRVGARNVAFFFPLSRSHVRSFFSPLGEGQSLHTNTDLRISLPGGREEGAVDRIEPTPVLFRAFLFFFTFWLNKWICQKKHV